MDVITEGVPDGWMIRTEWRWNGMDAEPAYVALRWGTKEVRRFMRKSTTRTGWLRQNVEWRHLEDAREWICRTNAQMQRP